MKKFALILLMILGVKSAIAQNSLDKLGITIDAASAYSLRKLRTSYSGSAIQVRRSSDQTIQDIGFTLNGDLDTTALKTFVGANNGLVTIWYDQSGNSRNLTQTNTSKQPSIVNAGVIYRRNGLPVVFHDAIDDGMLFSGSNYLTSNPLSVNIVASSNGNNVVLRRAVQGTSNWLIGPYSNLHAWYAGGWNHSFSEPWSTSNLETFTVIQPASTAATSFRNGAGQTSSNNKGVPNKIQTGVEGAYAEPFNGVINEIMAFNSELSTVNRKTLEGNQSVYYGICLLSTQPSAAIQSVVVGETPTNLTVLSEDPSATYQWYSNTLNANSGGTLLSGEIGTSYTPNTSTEGTLYYYAIITTPTNTCTSNVSGAVRVGIEITAHPSTTNQTIIQTNAATTISVTTTGSNLTYQWYKNTVNSNSGGTLISGVTSNSYSPATTDLGTTYYYVVVSGNNTILTSNTSGSVRVIANPIVWNGIRITFTKSNYANYNSVVNQDVINNNVKITRGNEQGLFNIATESYYGSNSPANTEWAEGTLANYLTLTYRRWQQAMNNNPPSSVNKTYVVHLINENIYFELTMLSWTEAGNGGGFSYSRTTPSLISPTITNFTNISKYYLDGSFTLTAPTSNSAGAFNYTSSNTAVATINGTTVTIVGAGTTTITANQAANASYQSGTSTAVLTVSSITVINKSGENSNSKSTFVNKNGALNTSKGLTKNGEIKTTKSN